MTHRKEQK